jgi:putative transposase
MKTEKRIRNAGMQEGMRAFQKLAVQPSSSILECGDSSPLSQGDLSPSNADARETPPASSNEVLFKRPWPHAPVHRLSENGVYFVTAGTLDKRPFFRGDTRLDLLEFHLLTKANLYCWQIEAWAVFANHYHFVARGCPESENLGKLIKHLHADTARELNKLDGTQGRKVWHNFRDTRLTFDRSYFARLNYVHQNAVHHGLVAVANQYKWCSAAWFERVVTPAMVQTIYGFKTDRLEVDDDF